MAKICLVTFALLSYVCVCAQDNYYWIRFTDKNNNPYSLSNPQQYLSQKSIDRRVKQGLSLNQGDLPITPSYIDSIVPHITKLKHRLKWFNMVVVKIDNPGMLQTTILEREDTTVAADTFSMTIFDTTVVYYRITVLPTEIIYDTLTTSKMDTVFDSIVHPGPVFIRDSIFLTDVMQGNKFDSLRQYSFVDTIAGIEYPPTLLFRRMNKAEHVYPVDQTIVYPNKYGVAYRQINMLNADLLHQMGYRGKGMTIAMFDNGFYNVNTIAAYDSVRSKIISTWDFVNDETNVYNDGGHGTNTFSCIAANVPNRFLGTAPDANFYLFTTEDNSAEWVMEEYNWAAAAEYADSAGADIFSTSLGYTVFDEVGSHTYSDLNGHKTVITNAANCAFGKGILILNSAGNEGAGSWHYISAPADGDSVLAIGAVDSARLLANFSGRGPNALGRVKPDICAMGVNSGVVTTSGDIGTSGGTSFSCPIMAGCAASLWGAYPDRSAREIYDAIMISADRFWSPGNEYGYGIPNFYNAYLFLKTNYNTAVLQIEDDAIVFPNPFSDELNISFYGDTSETHKIEIFDLQGRKVFENEIFIRDNTFEIANPEVIRALQAGIYILRFDGKTEFAHRIVKVK